MGKIFTAKAEIPEFVKIITSDIGKDGEIARVISTWNGHVSVIWAESVEFVRCEATYEILNHTFIEPTTSDWIRHAERLGYEVS